MDPMKSNGTLATGHVARGRQRRQALGALGGGLVTATVIAVSMPGIARAATPPGAQLSFSPATIRGGTQPNMTFISQNVPAGSLLYLQESSDGGRQWKTVDKTTNTQGTANIAVLPAGEYEFRVAVTGNGSTLGVSAPAPLTVTGPGGTAHTAPTAAPAQSPAATAVPPPAPSGSGIPWLDIIVKPFWEAVVGGIVAWVISLL
jgi:hypothetical protein